MKIFTGTLFAIQQLTLLFAINTIDDPTTRCVLKDMSDTGLQNISRRLQDDMNQRQSDTIRFLSVIEGSALKFVYWNNKLGNNKPINIEFGYERKIINSWIRGKPLKLITHGFLSSINNIEVMSIKSAYVSTLNYNIITVDWSKLSKIIVYPIPSYLTVRVGSIVAEFLENIVNLGLINSSDIHLIGHSLGSHVFGATGAAFSLGKIGRITGLDPAGPGFENSKWDTQSLNASNAQFVDVIHTAAGVSGYVAPIGHVDFYPNLGVVPQPECEYAFPPIDFISPLICSHVMSTEFYADSVYHRKTFVSFKCSTAEEFTSGQCKNNTKNFMGHDADPSKKGIYYLDAHTIGPPIGTKDLVIGYFN